MSKIQNKIILLGVTFCLTTCHYTVNVKSLSCLKFSSKKNYSNTKSSFLKSGLSNVEIKHDDINKSSSNINYKNLSIKDVE